MKTREEAIENAKRRWISKIYVMWWLHTHLYFYFYFYFCFSGCFSYCVLIHFLVDPIFSSWLIVDLIQFNFDHLFVFLYIENWGSCFNSLINGMSSFTSLPHYLSIMFNI
jgi:hypothetical protein